MTDAASRRALAEEGRHDYALLEKMVRHQFLLAPTALCVACGAIGTEDVHAIHRFLTAVCPRTDANQRLYEHLYLTASFAGRIATRLHFNPHEFEVLGLLHDVGRFFTHRYYRNDLLADLALRRLEVRRDLLAMLPPSSLLCALPADFSFGSLTDPQKIVILADVSGKRTDSGRIWTFDDMLAHHRRSRSDYQAYTGMAALWPSERRGLRAINPALVERWAEMFVALRDWLRSTGVDLASVRDEIERDEAHGTDEQRNR